MWLTRAERGALAAAAGGEPVELTDQTIRAEVLRAICLDLGQLVKDRVEVRGARVLGRLSLKCQHLRHGLRFHRCHFTEGADLTGADCAEPIEFEECELGDLAASTLNAAKDVRFRHCCHGRISLASADIDGDLVLSGSRLGRSGPAALTAPDLVVAGSVLLNEGFRADGGVNLRGSRIGKDLDCRNGQFHHPHGADAVDPWCAEPALDASSVVVGGEVIFANGFKADGEVRLRRAEAHAVCFRGARLANPAGVAIGAEGLQTGAGLYLDQLRAAGTVRLVGARIGGEVVATSGSFDNRGGAAIEADRLVAQDVYLNEGFCATGRVSLIGARLGRQLNCTGGRFHNPAGVALDAIELHCAGTVYLNRESADSAFQAEGQVQLAGATVAGDLNCTGGVFASLTGFALDASGLSTEGDVLLDDFRAVGGVRLRDADVAGNVSLTEARLGTCMDGTTLDAHGLRVGNCLVLRLAEHPAGVVDFSFAAIGRLDDTKKSWPREGPVRLNGFTYGLLECGEIDRAARLALLKRMPEYERQPYQQLGKVYREAGKVDDARRVAIEGLAEMRRRDKLPWYSKAWNWFLETTVGYGHELWRAIVLLLVIGVLNIFLYHEAEHEGLMVPAGAQTSTSQGGDTEGRNGTGQETFEPDKHHCPRDYPCFTPYAYSFQLLIPLINLQQLEKWTPDARQEWGGLLLFYTWLTVAVGWALGVAVAGGLNNVLRKE